MNDEETRLRIFHAEVVGASVDEDVPRIYAQIRAMPGVAGRYQITIEHEAFDLFVLEVDGWDEAVECATALVERVRSYEREFYELRARVDSELVYARPPVRVKVKTTNGREGSA